MFDDLLNKSGIFAALMSGDKETTLGAVEGMRTLIEMKTLIVDELYKRYGYLSEGLRFKHRGQEMVVLKADPTIAGYYLAAYVCDGVFERTDMPARAIYCPKSAHFTERLKTDPAGLYREVFSDPNLASQMLVLVARYKQQVPQ